MQNDKRIYITHFMLKLNPVEQFVKIGISQNPLETRFAPDLRNYNIKMIAETEYYTASDARIVESNFHEIFRAHAVRPQVPLASGNTECFRYSRYLVDKVLAILSGKHVATTRNKRRSRSFSDEVRQTLTPSFRAVDANATKALPIPMFFRVHKRGTIERNRAMTTTERTSRWRPDAGVMFAKEAELYKKRKKAEAIQRRQEHEAAKKCHKAAKKPLVRHERGAGTNRIESRSPSIKLPESGGSA